MHEARVWWRELDAQVLGPRIASLLFLASGVLALFVSQVVPAFDGVDRMELIAIAAAVFGAITLVLPWQRWAPSAQLVYALFAFFLFAWGGMLEAGTAGPYLAALPLPFVYVGFMQRPGASVLLAPFAALALLVAARFEFDSSLMTSLLFALPMSVIVGETIAQAQLHRARADHRIERLLDVVRVFGRVENERIGAQLVAARSAELLGAQAVSVMLTDRPGSNRYLNRAFFGHPALADAAPLLLESLHDGRPTGRTRFVALPRTVGAVRAAAIIELPGAGGRALGLVVAMWGTPRRRLNPAARQAAELLSEEAGRMFQRIRDAAVLEYDAHTDPLTELANRRTFARALQTLQPGDAVVIADLDYFKTVNDRFGHETGDTTLRALARCLRETARQVDTVARYGGEEFAMVLPGAGADGARTMLRRTREVWAAQHPITTFSAGIAVHEAGRDPIETMRRADSALYEAKEAGRDCDVLAEPEIILP